MKIINGKIVTPYQPELILAALQFLDRAQMGGPEAETFVAVKGLLHAIREGHYVVQEAPVQEPKPALGTEI